MGLGVCERSEHRPALLFRETGVAVLRRMAAGRIVAETGAVRLEVLDGGVAAIVLDAPSAPFVFDEARDQGARRASCKASRRDSDLRGVVVRSTHPEIFCAGADVDAMAAVSERAEIERLVLAGQNAFEELARLAVPRSR